MHLENSSAVVTGGASGLGLATVQALLARGVLVTILDLPTSQGAQVAESLGAAASFAPGDVRDDEAVAAAVALADGRAPLRTLVHCAGRGGTVRVLDKAGAPGDYDLYREIVAVNLFGTFNVLRHAASAMAAHEPIDGERGVCGDRRGARPRAAADPRVHGRAGGVRHADPQPLLAGHQGRAGGAGPAPVAAGSARGVCRHRNAHRRQRDAQRRDDSS